METYRNNEYTITTSLSDHHIIINLTNNVSYACYEGEFEHSTFFALRLPFDLSAMFKLINKCFAEFVEPTGKSTYKLTIGLTSNAGTELDFDCSVDGFLPVVFKLRMVEKTSSGGSDKGLIIELNRWCPN